MLQAITRPSNGYSAQLHVHSRLQPTLPHWTESAECFGLKARLALHDTHPFPVAMFFWLKKVIGAGVMPLPFCLVLLVAGLWLTRVPQRGMDERAIVVTRWDPVKSAFFALSKNGGAPL